MHSLWPWLCWQRFTYLFDHLGRDLLQRFGLSKKNAQPLPSVRTRHTDQFLALGARRRGGCCRPLIQFISAIVVTGRAPYQLGEVFPQPRTDPRRPIVFGNQIRFTVLALNGFYIAVYFA